jgi:iron complex transport system substrate-binding protein
MGEGDPYAFLNEIGTCVVYIPTSETFEDIYEDISFLGQLVNKPSEANTLIQEMKERVSLVQEKAATVTEKKTVYFEVAPAPTIYTAGSGSFINEMITLAGGINIFASESAWFSPSEEAIITANPDIIFTNTDYIDNALSEIKSREGWTNISAITNNQVYMIDANQSSRPSQFAVEALESLSRLMYPTLYE